MGGKGSGRLDKTSQLLKSQLQKKNAILINKNNSNAMFMPNHSGDHSAGSVLTTPVNDNDLVNKKYVDDNAGTGLWEVDGTETQLIIADEIDMQTKKIINVTNPTDAQDVATKDYADSLSTSPAGSDTYVQFNDGGSFGGDSGLKFNSSTNALSVHGNINGGTNAADDLNILANSHASPDGDITFADYNNILFQDKSGNNQITFSEDGATVFNEEGNDVDFRIESTSKENAFFIEGSSGNAGFKTGTPESEFHFKAGDSGKSGSSTSLFIENDGSHPSYYVLKVASGGDNDSFNIQNTGNIGMSVADPQKKLDIDGDVQITQNSSFTWSSYCSITTTANSTASTSTRDIFDEDNYSAYTSDANVTASGLVYTQSDGRFTFTNAGIYLITISLNLQINSPDEIDIILKKNGTAFYEHDTYIHSAVDPVFRTITLIKSMDAADYLNVFVGSSDGVDSVTFHSGCSCTINRIA